jgi:hypothetical protein
LLAARLRSRDGAPLADVFTFVSGLYFRGKIAYARHFAAPSHGADGVHVITTNRGLLHPDTPISRRALEAFGSTSIDPDEAGYRRPLERSASALRRRIGDTCEVVLLGSIASDKYVELLTGIFGARLVFPIAFVGRGDMSRGGLLLRQVREDAELQYAPIMSAVRHGTRPPKLPPLDRAAR